MVVIVSELVARTEEQYTLILTELSIAIDETRGLFRNIAVGSAEEVLFPFEPIKEFFSEIKELGFGEHFSPTKSFPGSESDHRQVERCPELHSQ